MVSGISTIIKYTLESFSECTSVSNVVGRKEECSRWLGHSRRKPRSPNPVLVLGSKRPHLCEQVMWPNSAKALNANTHTPV